MANYKNKTYSSTLKTLDSKDYGSYYYHKKQEEKQNKLIASWLKTKNPNKI